MTVLRYSRNKIGFSPPDGRQSSISERRNDLRFETGQARLSRQRDECG